MSLLKRASRLTRAEIEEAKYQVLCARTERRQRAAKEALERSGIAPRVQIGSMYVPPRIARHFMHSDTVGGVR